MADAATEASLEERELDPGSDAGGNGEAGDTPALLDAEEARKRQGGEITKSGGEHNTNDSESEGSTRVAKSVVARGVEATKRGCEKADGGTGENSPNINDVGVGEAARLIDGRDDDIAECEEANDRRNNEEADLTETVVEASAKNAGDFVGFTEGAAHDGKFGGGNGHTEKADRESVERLRVGERGDGAGGQPTGEKGVDVRTDLDDAAADENGEEIAEDGANVFGFMGKGEF